MEYLEIINSIVLVILVALFFMQQKILNSVKTFFEIFDIKKVKEYVKMNEETVLGKATNLITDDAKVREIMHEVTNSKVDEISQFYKEVMGNEHIELFKSNVHLLENCLKGQKDEQIRYVNEFLPHNKDKILPILFPEDFEDKNP